MSHQEPVECKYCLYKDQQIRLARTEHAFIVVARRDGKPVPGLYLAVPNAHVTIEPNWFVRAVDHMVTELAVQSGVQIDNRSVNLTKRGGKTNDDEHFSMLLLDRHDNLQLDHHGLLERATALSEECTRLRARLTSNEFARNNDLATSGLPL